MSQETVRLDSSDFVSDLGRALVDAGDVAVIVLDSALVIQDANATARRVLGAPLASGDTLSSAVDGDDVRRVRAAASGEGEPAGPLLVRSSSDPERPSAALLVSPVPVPHGDGTVLALVGRPATEELERTSRVLRARRWEIVGQLTSGVAHDLNNRLSTVTTFSDLLLGDAEPGSQDAEDLAEIKQAGLDAANITRKLDLFAGGHAGGATDCALPDVVRGFEKLIRRFAGNAITVETELDDGCPRVGAPPIRIEEMLIALVANARDAMPDGGTLTLRAVSGGAGDPDGSAVLEVVDTGASDAIPEMERAMEPFFSSTAHGRGSGLGLGTVAGIATELGGRVSLHRIDGRTVARVVLPGVTDRGEGTGEDGRAGSTDGGQSLRVGLVEPDGGGRDALARRLTRGGADVVAVSVPGELGPDAFPMDAVLLDVPDEPGAGSRLLEDVRARDGGVPVILLRRRASPRVTPPGTPGVLELAKPIDPGELLETVRLAASGAAGNPGAQGTDAR